MAKENKIRDAADAVRGIAESVPVYQDALQPAMQEVGKGLQTIAKTIHVALAPISALVCGYDTIKDFVATRVAQKLEGIPPEQIKTPEPNVVGPALEALRYTGHQESLRELYANLLATSLDSETAHNAHPSFPEIIRNMSPDEAKIMRLFATRSEIPVIDVRAKEPGTQGFVTLVRNFSFIGEEAGCDHVSLTTSYLDNLGRFGLLQVPGYAGMGEPHLADEDAYDRLASSSNLDSIKEEIVQDGHEVEVIKKLVGITTFGTQFCQACVLDKSMSGSSG